MPLVRRIDPLYGQTAPDMAVTTAAHGSAAGGRCRPSVDALWRAVPA